MKEQGCVPIEFLFIKTDSELNWAHRPEFANPDLDNRTVSYQCVSRKASSALIPDR